ncbi:DMT family transporter (plasmid) [Photobacterium sp. GJ3]|uniref:DMT family transporter n=1 Tax=Photobacterium sp. GJ3 TaxID=2829502 RepID=UPI001B8C1D90|nr:DMT family transporter [Photobacterium sp. GJ3]QUJ69408.1 DMT family transporter [Photobacterium sp. GJ3]
MSERKPVDAAAVGMMIVFCFVMGLQQIFLKATGDDIAPILQIGIRSGIAACLVCVYLVLRRKRLSFADGNWKPGLLVGLLFAVEYLFLGEALRYTSASHAVVFLYTSPLFSALMLHFLIDSERLSVAQWTGILLAFGGIAITFLLHDGTSPVNTQPNQLWGDFLALLGGLAWGATVVLIRSTRLARVPSEQTLLYQLTMACLVLVATAFLTGQTTINPTPLAITSVAFQTLVISFAGLLVWFWMLNTYIASRLGVLSFMTPLYGVVLGAWLLDEAIEPGFVYGASMVITGIVLVSGHGWIKQRLWRAVGRRKLPARGKG